MAKQHLEMTEKTDPNGRPIYMIGGTEMSEDVCKARGIIPRDSGRQERTAEEIIFLNRRGGQKMRGESVPV